MRRKTTHQKQCRVCGKDFMCTDSRRVFCSNLCRNIYRSKYKHDWYVNKRELKTQIKGINTNDRIENIRTAKLIAKDLNSDKLRELGFIE